MENSMKHLVILLCAAPFAASAVEVPIEGTVQSRCIIQTDTAGVYGNPNAYTLTTAPTDGGVLPIVRYDVSLADAYKAKITHPSSFSSSPSLNDTPTWSGSTEVSTVGDAGMSGYEAAKVTYGNTTEYDLTVAGSTWFKTNSTVVNGGNKALPGGTYRAVVEAECIAK
jgi:hypothetical protein